MRLYSNTYAIFGDWAKACYSITDVHAYKKMLKDVYNENYNNLKIKGIFIFDRLLYTLGYSVDVVYDHELLYETVKGTQT